MYKYIVLLFSLIFSTFSCFSNPIDDIEYKKNDFFNFFIEIPAGTSQKWELNKSSGDLCFRSIFHSHTDYEGVVVFHSLCVQKFV